jgi:hypothetical protein
MDERKSIIVTSKSIAKLAMFISDSFEIGEGFPSTIYAEAIVELLERASEADTTSVVAQYSQKARPQENENDAQKS